MKSFFRSVIKLLAKQNRQQPSTIEVPRILGERDLYSSNVKIVHFVVDAIKCVHVVEDGFFRATLDPFCSLPRINRMQKQMSRNKCESEIVALRAAFSLDSLGIPLSRFLDRIEVIVLGVIKLKARKEAKRNVALLADDC